MRCQPQSNTVHEMSEKPLTSGRMRNALPSAEQNGVRMSGKPWTSVGICNLLPSATQQVIQSIVKAVDERENERCAEPSAMQYGGQSIVKTVDDWKNEQSAGIR